MTESLNTVYDRVIAFIKDKPAFQCEAVFPDTPFRGSLFGSQNMSEIDDKLRGSGGIDVLWYGSTPRHREQGQQIADGGAPSSDWLDKWTAHRQSKHNYGGGFGPHGSKDGVSIFKGDAKSKHWQKFYRWLVEAVPGCDADRVAMANYFIWGERYTNAFKRHMRRADLWHEVSRFHKKLHQHILVILNPKVVVVPNHVCDDMAWLVGESAEQNWSEHGIRCEIYKSDGKYLQRNGKHIAVICAWHPSNRDGDAAKERLFAEVGKYLDANRWWDGG